MVKRQIATFRAFGVPLINDLCQAFDAGLASSGRGCQGRHCRTFISCDKVRDDKPRRSMNWQPTCLQTESLCAVGLM